MVSRRIPSFISFSFLFLIPNHFFIYLRAGEKCTVYMRDHPCFCTSCIASDSNECSQLHTVGAWKAINMTRKIIAKVYDSVPESLFSVTKFFDGLITQSASTILVGIHMTDKVSGVKQTKIAILAVPSRINTKEMQSSEHHMEKCNYNICVPKGMAMVRVKLMLRHPNTVNQFFLPTNSKLVNFPITDLVYPILLLSSNSVLDRYSYIDFATNETSHTNHQLRTSTQITYTINSSSME